MVNWRNTPLRKLEGENEITSAFDMVINKAYELGFQYCSFKMSSQLPNHQINPFELSNYPNEWTSLYEQGHFFDVDPIVKRCKECVLPIVWEEKPLKTHPAYGLWPRPLALTWDGPKRCMTSRACSAC